MHITWTRIVLMLAVLLAGAGLARADSEEGTVSVVAKACAAAPSALDCGCVSDTFAEASTGLEEGDQLLLADMALASMGLGDGAAVAKASPEAMSRIAGRVPPVMQVGTACLSDGVAGRPVSAALSDEARGVAEACAGSGYSMDCGCVAARFDEAVGAGAPASEAAQAVRADLGLGEAAASDAARAALGNFREACAVTDPDGQRGAEAAAAGPAASLEARADASDPALAMRMQCESKGSTTRYCGCQTAMFVKALSPDQVRYKGALARAEAERDLGWLDGGSHIAEAAAEMGYADAEAVAKLRELIAATNAEWEKAHYACLEYLR